MRCTAPSAPTTSAARPAGCSRTFPTAPSRPGAGLAGWRPCAEHLSKGANPRFVVTSLPAERYGARTLYEDLYCARGDMENRIKEQQLDLFADRTSTHTLRANQIRLYFASFAYVLLCALRRLALHDTELALRPVRQPSPEAAQDRRPDPHQCAPGRGRFLRGIPRRRTIPPGAGPHPSVTALCQGAVTRPGLIDGPIPSHHRCPRATPTGVFVCRASTEP